MNSSAFTFGTCKSRVDHDLTTAARIARTSAGARAPQRARHGVSRDRGAGAMSSKIGKRQQKRGRFDPSGAVTSPAFRRKLESLPDENNASFGDASNTTPSGTPPDSEDAAAAFKKRALAFASLQSTAEEQNAMGGLIEALSSLAAGERVAPREKKNEDGDGGQKKKGAPKKKAGASANQRLDQDPTRLPIEPAFSMCLECLLDVLFLPNSRPLHRAIVSMPRAFPPRARSIAEKKLADALAARIRAARSATTSSGAARLRVLGVLFSVVACQPQTAAERRIVRAVAVDAAALIGEGVLEMIQETETGRRVPPAEMETCQEAISVAYALLQRHPGTFLGLQFEARDEDETDDEDAHAGNKNPVSDGAFENKNALRAASSLITSLYRALQGGTLSREAAVSAGVTVAAAVGAGVADPKRHAAALADAFVGVDDDASDAASSWCGVNGVDPAPTESLALATSVRPTTFSHLSDAMNPFGRLCAARGVLTAASAEALSFPLEVPNRARRLFEGGARGDRFASPRMEKNKTDGKPPWTLLTSYLFPYICASLERPEDSHHKYHAAAALRAALVRVKALAASGARRRNRTDSGLGNSSSSSLDEVFPAPLRDRVCVILWANWEDPLSQTVKETHLSFETLLDIEEARGSMTDTQDDGSAYGFLEDAAKSLLKKDTSNKGRYVPLAAVARRLGAKRLLRLAPDLLAKTLTAMKDDSVCTAAGALVAAVSQSLLFETTSLEDAPDDAQKSASLPGAKKAEKLRRAGKDEGTVAAAGSKTALQAWRNWWVGPLTEALLSPGRQRAGAGTYALPAFLKQDGASVVPLLARIQDEGKASHTRRDTSAVASAVVAVLRSARALGLLDPEDPSRVSSRVAKAAARTFEWQTSTSQKKSKDDGEVGDDDDVDSYGVDPDLLLAAATRRDARSRRDALDLLCVDGKRFSLPGVLERSVLRAAIPTHLRDADAAFRGALVSSLTHLLTRIRAGCCKAAVFARARPELLVELFDGVSGRESPNAEKTENASASRANSTRGARCFGAHAKGVRAVDDDEASRLIKNAFECVSFTEWLTTTLVRSAYPGAPYERKQTALDLLLAVAEAFPPETSSMREKADASHSYKDYCGESLASQLEASPYSRLCLGPDVVTCLLGAMVDSWDKLRVCAFRLLSKHPAPLAGVEDAESVAAHFNWALSLSRSPRVRESDAAALLLRLLFRKYALDGGWDITLTPEPVATPPPNGMNSIYDAASRRRARTAKLLGTMCDLIEHECEKAERDLFAACRQSLAHGALLATRYVLEEIDFSFADDCDDDDDAASPRLLVKASLARLLRLMERITATALRSISAPDGANVGAAAADIAPDRKGGGSGQGAAAARAAARATSGVGGTTAGDDFSLSLGDGEDDDDDDDERDELSFRNKLAPRAQMIVTACWLTMKEVSLVIGELTRRVDVDASSDASESLLDPAQLRDAGHRLLTTLLTLKHNGAIEKTLVGLTCLGERLLRSPDARLSCQPREWLDVLFERTTKPEQDVRDLIRRSAGIPFGFMAVFLAEPRGVPRALLHEALEKLLDLANDDGEHVRRGEVARGQSQGVYVPQVHAFNVLRFVFADKELSTETVGFAAKGLTAAIKGFSSPHWEVRNGATLAFAALLTKVVGYMNVANPAAGGASRRAVAGDDFFRRFPSTHPFLLAKLVEAADALESKTDSSVHPALYPILALLSRLRPAAGAPASEKEDGEDDVKNRGGDVSENLDPAAFAPAVRRCARGRVHAVRAAAARALAPLIKAEDVARALAETFRDAQSSDDDVRSYKNTESTTRRPRLGYNAAHGALLCASELLSVEGPAEAGTTKDAMAAVEAASLGLERCSYLVDPEASPVAAAAAAWALCAHETLRLARSVRDKLKVLSRTDEVSRLDDDDDDDVAPTKHVTSVRRFFSASRRLTRLARAACDIPSSARGFVYFSGGGDAARCAADRGVSVAPGDVEWLKRAARLSCVAALDTEGFYYSSDDDGGRASSSDASSSDVSDEGFSDGDETSETENLSRLEEDAAVAPTRGRRSDANDALGKTRRRDRNRSRALRSFLSALGPSLPYESRASALRALRDAGAEKVLDALGSYRFRRLKTFVSETLLPSEKRHACQRRALQVLEQWTDVFVSEDEEGDEDVEGDDDRDGDRDSDLSRENTWRVVLRLASAETNERVRCAATVLLGKLTGSILRRLRSRMGKQSASSVREDDAGIDIDTSNDASMRVSSLVALVKAGSVSARPLDVRRAAARALANSEILKELPTESEDETLGHLPLDEPSVDSPKHLTPLHSSCLVAWTAAFELMEDEDEQTRDIAAVACAEATGGDKSAHTEATLRFSFDVVARAFRNTASFQVEVAGWISGGFVQEDDEDTGLSKPLLDAVNETKIVRRLFDREADNHHAEGLLLAQLAARAVAEAPYGQTVTKPFAAARLLGAARAVAVAARTLEGESARGTSHTSETHTTRASDAKVDVFPGWAGGATNHGAAFAIVNRACLALWAYARAAGDEARREARLVLVTERVAETFEAARLGPAANAAWRAAQAAVEDAKDTTDATIAAPRVGGAFETYDPCFLLR